MEEAPTITEELAKEPRSEKEANKSCEKRNNPKKITNESQQKSRQNYFNHTNFKVLALIGTEVFGKEGQVRKNGFESLYCSQSSPKEEIVLTASESFPHRSQGIYESLEDSKGKKVGQGVPSQHKSVTEKKTQSKAEKDKLKSMRIREECEVRKGIVIKSVSSTDNIDEEIDIDMEDPEVDRTATKIQANFRGQRTRNEMKKGKLDNSMTIEEEVDMNLNDPEVEKAALKIQPSFRGQQTRHNLSNGSKPSDYVGDSDNQNVLKKNLEDPDSNNTGTYISNDSLKENRSKIKEDIEQGLEESEIDKVALKIQSSFGGNQRKKNKVVELKNEHGETPVEIDNLDESKTNSNNIEKGENDIDIDMEDPEVDRAALKIQASFRGRKARKDVEKLKRKEIDPVDNSLIGEKQNLNHIDIDLADSDVSKAAVKIQSSFRGQRARKDIAEMKVNGEIDRKPEKFAKKNKSKKTSKGKQIGFWEDPVSNEVATSFQEGYRGMMAKEQMEKDNDEEKRRIEQKSRDIEEKLDIDFNDPIFNEAATSIQAGYRGMEAREKMEEENDEENVRIQQKNWDIEERLDISFDDPKVVEAATKIQAGFRGVKTRRNLKNPTIVVDKMDTEYSEFESETSYSYEDEDEESESLQERPKTPKTAVEDFSQSISSIAGFKATAMIGSWIQRKNLRPKPITTLDEDDIATKIQAGYRGMKTREESRPKPPTIAGFRATAYVTNWSKKNKKREKIIKPMTDIEEDEVATKIQSGFRGMKIREKVNGVPVENKSILQGLHGIMNIANSSTRFAKARNKVGVMKKEKD